MTLVLRHLALICARRRSSPPFYTLGGRRRSLVDTQVRNNRVLSVNLSDVHLTVVMLTDATIPEFFRDFCRYMCLLTRNAVRWQILKSMC